MGNMLSRAVEVHAKALERAAGIDVLILRGGRTSLPLKAVPATSTHLVTDEDRIPVKVKSFDWIFAIGKLQTACTEFPGFCELLQGDVIERQSDKKRFSVQPVTPGRPVNEPHDTYGVMSVTHTQET